MSACPKGGCRIPISVEGEESIQAMADELEVLAEEIRVRGLRGHLWGELLPQWDRLRQLEQGVRWRIEERRDGGAQ